MIRSGNLSLLGRPVRRLKSSMQMQTQSWRIATLKISDSTGTVSVRCTSLWVSGSKQDIWNIRSSKLWRSLTWEASFFSKSLYNDQVHDEDLHILMKMAYFNLLRNRPFKDDSMFQYLISRTNISNQICYTRNEKKTQEKIEMSLIMTPFSVNITP